MIYVYYNKSSEKLTGDTFDYLFNQLPHFIQVQIMKFIKWEDRQRSLLGKTLLIKGLKNLGLSSYSLDTLKLTAFQKPYFDANIDFNISHSGEYTICAISLTNRIGIDVEEIQDIYIPDFDSQFSRMELEEILQAKDSLHAFYTLWTRKEAFVKAIGKGLYVPLNEINVMKNRICWENEEWFLHEIKLEQRYISHLSTDNFSPVIVIEKVDF